MIDPLNKPEKMSTFDLFLKSWHIDLKFTRLRYLSVIPLFVGLAILNIGPRIFLFIGIFFISLSVVLFIFFYIYAEKEDLPYAIEKQRRMLNDISSNEKFNETVTIWTKKYYLTIFTIITILGLVYSFYVLFGAFNVIKH